MKIPFLNMAKEAEFLVKSGLTESIEKVILSGQYLFGPQTKRLEEQLSELFNAYAVLVGSGTDALYLSLRALGIGPGDRVGIPTISAIPTAVAVKMTGAEPVFIEVQAGTMLMDYSKIDMELSALIPVHLYGNPVGDEIFSTCNSMCVPVIEDCAQSFGARLNGKLTGTIGQIGAFSFYPSKNLGAYGDSGAVITNNSNLAEEIKELRFYGQKNRSAMGYKYGMNSRTDEIQAAILLAKLKYQGQLEQKRLEMLLKYKTLDIRSVYWKNGCMPHLYPIFVGNRKKFMNLMNKMGIETAIHYPFTLPAAIEKSKEKYVIAENACNHIVSLPFNPWMTDKEIDYLLETAKKCADEAI